jgi:phage regulator Rha-like protein
MNLTIIQQKIYEVRGERVMLDFDQALLYEVETRVFNQAVKRNKDSFPQDFMFQLTAEEWRQISSSQFVMMENLPKNRTGKYLPYAFTEHGVTMLASILKSPKAREMNVTIVRAFIALKKFTLQHKDLAVQLQELRQELYERIGEHDTQLAAIYDAIENLLDDKTEKKSWDERERIGFKK